MTGRTAFIRLLLAATITVAALPSAWARGGPFGFWPQQADATMREVLDTPYAKAFLKQFAANVRKDGDAACLQEKGLDEAALIARGQALVQVRGTQFMKLLEENFDDAAAQAAFAASAGPKAAAEFEKLLQHPDARRLETLGRPIKLAELTDKVFEQFDRYLLIQRIKLYPASPVARGESDNAVTRADPSPAAQAAMERFVAKKGSPRVVGRYLELMDAQVEANRNGLRKGGLGKLTAAQFFAGADQDLAELCVGKR
jgi:hypothetical protein